jgi:predicted CopG family antitoxin
MRNKIITEYESFLEKLDIEDNDPDPIKDAKETLNNFEEDIEEFHKKKKDLSDLIENSEGEDIEKDIEKIIEKEENDNDLIKHHLAAQTLRKNILGQDNRVNYFSKLKQQRIDNKAAANTLSDKEEKEDQHDSLDKQIKDIDNNVDDVKSDMRENEKELKEKEKDLDDYIKDSEKKMDDARKELNR